MRLTWTTASFAFICLLCNDKLYSVRNSLAQHNKNHHIVGGTFNQLFPCTQCRRDFVPSCSSPPQTISSATGWADHVETTHGKRYAPVVTEKHLSNTAVHQQKLKREEEDGMITEPSLSSMLGDFSLA
jgi:hypothetical protein